MKYRARERLHYQSILVFRQNKKKRLAKHHHDLAIPKTS